MEQSAENPATNQLPIGVNESDLYGAVAESGYPLQHFVSEKFGDDFYVQEEWAYIDRDSGELRSLDVRAQKYLWDRNEPPRVRPTLNLFMECKQTFRSYSSRRAGGVCDPLSLPSTGCASPNVDLRSDENVGCVIPSFLALGLNWHPFQLPQAISSTFSKAVRKGKKVELSGTEAYSGLVMPLVKAVAHAEKTERPKETAEYFDAHLSIAIGVLDAPMVLVRPEPTGNVLQLTPWVRVQRHEYLSEGEILNRDRHLPIDLVHKDFLQNYLDQHLQPFADEFARRVLRHQLELATGKASIDRIVWGDFNGNESRDGAAKRFKRCWGIGEAALPSA